MRRSTDGRREGHPLRDHGQDQKALQSYYSSLFGWKLNTDNPAATG
jgi:hypothetical protein